MENDRFKLNRNSDVKVIYIGTGQFQLASGKWVDAILYKYRGVYKMMEASEFIRLAEPDKSTTIDKVGDIIGHGYTPGFKDKTQIPAEEVECADPAQDDGPLYRPWYVVESDKDEDSNRAK